MGVCIMPRLIPRTLDQLEEDMEDARIKYERWLQLRRNRRPRAEGFRYVTDDEDHRLDDPRHKQGDR